MIVLVGASASGKTELAKLLFCTYGYRKCITTTTRPMRSNEKQDMDYHFVTTEIFLGMKAKDLFVEVTQYQNNFYGTQKKDVVLNGVVIVDPRGANVLIDNIGNDLFVVYVESLENLRRTRMLNRGDERAKVEERLISDALIFKPEALKRIDLCLQNDENSLPDLARFIHQNYRLKLKNNK